MLLILAVANLIFVTSCGYLDLGVSPTNSKLADDEISGLIPNLSQTNQKVSEFDSEGCSERTVSLHRLLSESTPQRTSEETETFFERESLVSTQVNSDGSFVLSNIRSKGVTLSELGVKYILRAQACSRVYFRPLTELTAQKITLSSTLFTMTESLSSVDKKSLNSIDRQQLTEAINKVESLIGNDSASALETFKTNSQVQTIFQQVLNVVPETIVSSPPIRIDIVPTYAQPEEGSLLTYTAKISSWDPSYQPSFAWYFDGAVASTLSTLNYRSGKNSQGEHAILLRVGFKTADGSIDTTRAFKTASLAIFIPDKFPIKVPGFDRDGGNLVNTTSGTIRLSTGPDLVNCETFSTLALTEDAFVPPLNPSAFNIECSDPITQTVSFSLSSNDGAKQLALWARDASGKTAVSPIVIYLTLDQTPPSLELPTPRALKGGMIHPVIFSAMDNLAGLNSLILEFSSDGSTFSPIGNLIDTTSPFSWSLAALNIGTARLRLSARDNAGNESILLTSPFTIDSTPPTVAITGPTADANFTTTLNLSGTCESGLAVIVSGTGVVADTANCVLGAFSKAVLLSDGYGSKNIIISQTDEAGNSSNANRNFNRVSTGPNLTMTAPSAGTSSQNGVTITGACESNIAISLSGTGLSSPTSGACTNSSYSIPIVFSTGDGQKNIVLTQTDATGVSTSVGRDFIKDTTSPILTRNSPPDTSAAQTSLILNGACESGLPLNISGTGLLANLTVLCNGGSFSQTVYFSNGEGTKLIDLHQTDLAGNSTTISTSFVRDNTAPSLTQTVASPVTNNLNTVTWSGSCEAGVFIQVTGADSANISCTSSVWTYTTQAQTTDANRTYTFTQTDGAGNSTTVSTQWVRDSIGPDLTFTSGSSKTSASNTVTFAGGCEAGRTITVAGTDSASFNCVGSVWTYSTMEQTTDGTRAYTFSQSDTTGNLTTITGSWTRNTQGPSLTLSTVSPVLNSANNATFTGGCDNSISINVSGAETKTINCQNGTWTFLSSNQTTDSTRTFTFSQKNSLGVSTTVSGQWIRDTTPPQFVANQFSLNNGASSAPNRFISVALKATDASSKITHFCLKYDSNTAPTVNDACWTAVNAPSPGLVPAPSLTIAHFTFAVGLADSIYTIYAWVRDELNNISTLSNNNGTTGLDKAQITISPGTPPSISGIIVANTNTPSTPATKSESTFTAGQNVFIKWKATDDTNLPSNPVKLYFSVDDINWTLITNSPLSNSAGAGCTINANQTGCYQWTAPVASFFRVRVLITDANQFTAQASSLPMNAGTLRVIAGNTDPGLGGSSKTAMFFNDMTGNARFPDVNTLVVTNEGRIFFRDYKVGILEVSPTDGRQTLFLKTTGTSTGDGGPIANATLKNPVKINIDFQNRLIIYDYDRIRRVDLNVNPPTISTIIGGGTSTDDTINDPLSLKMTEMMWGTNERNFRLRHLLTLSPNGDIYFRSDNNFPGFPFVATDRRIRVYRANASPSPKIESIYLGGLSGSTGAYNYPNLDLATCGSGNVAIGFNNTTGHINYIHYLVAVYNNTDNTQCLSGTDSIGDFTVKLNPTTFQSQGPHIDTPGGRINISVTGHNGKVYSFSRELGTIYRFDPDLSGATGGTYVQIVGTGTPGSCMDGTPALDCKIVPIDVYVTSDNQVYFMDRGLVRTITSNGTIATIAGQNASFGDGGPATEARFALANSVDIHRSGGNKVVIYDGVSAKIREFTIDGNIATIAGNGTSSTPDFTALATQQGLLSNGNHRWDMMVTNRTTGEVFAEVNPYNPAISKLNRTTGVWERIFGQGAIDYVQNDGNNASNSGFPHGIASGPIPFGISSTDLLVTANRPSPTVLSAWADIMYKKISLTNWGQSHFAGIAENPASGSFCIDGTPISTCSVHADDNSMIRAHYDATNARWLIGWQGWNAVMTFKPGGTKETLVSGLPRTIISFAFNDVTQTLYYCGDDGRVYKKVLSTGAHSALDWPMTSMSCTGASMVFDEVRNVLVFPFTQNGLFGVAEHSGI